MQLLEQMPLPSILQRTASYGFTWHCYDCHKKCPMCFKSFQNHDYHRQRQERKITRTRASLNITGWPRGSYLLQLLLELHGPQDDGTPHRVLHALHVGVHAVQGEHLPEARVPVHRLLRHVCVVPGVFRRLKDKKGKKEKKKRNVAKLTRETGEVYQNLPVVRGGQRRQPAALPNLAWRSSLLWQFTVLTATTPTHPRLVPDWRRAAGRKDAFQSESRIFLRFGPTAKDHQEYIWTNYILKKSGTKKCLNLFTSTALLRSIISHWFQKKCAYNNTVLSIKTFTWIAIDTVVNWTWLQRRMLLHLTLFAQSTV